MELYDKHFWCIEVNPGSHVITKFQLKNSNGRDSAAFKTSMIRMKINTTSVELTSLVYL